MPTSISSSNPTLHTRANSNAQPSQTTHMAGQSPIFRREGQDLAPPSNLDPADSGRKPSNTQGARHAAPSSSLLTPQKQQVIRDLQVIQGHCNELMRKNDTPRWFMHNGANAVIYKGKDDHFRITGRLNNTPKSPDFEIFFKEGFMQGAYIENTNREVPMDKVLALLSSAKFALGHNLTTTSRSPNPRFHYHD